MKLSTKLILVAATFISISCAYAGGDKLLADMTSYTFNIDNNYDSVCYDTCVQHWPPFMVSLDASANAGWGITARTYFGGR